MGTPPGKRRKEALLLEREGEEVNTRLISSNLSMSLENLTKNPL